MTAAAPGSKPGCVATRVWVRTPPSPRERSTTFQEHERVAHGPRGVGAPERVERRFNSEAIDSCSFGEVSRAGLPVLPWKGRGGETLVWVRVPLSPRDDQTTNLLAYP